MDDFLKESDDVLDVGYSLPLRVEAIAKGGSVAAKAFLLSRDVQAELKAFVVQCAAASLDV